MHDTIKQALKNVRSNLLRSVLTLMIIAFGIMSLVGILTAIDSAIFALNDNFSGLGANSFSIRPASQDGAKGNRRGRQAKRGEAISFRQAQKFKDNYDYPGKVTNYFYCTSLAEIKHQKEKTNPNVTVVAADEAYLDVKGLDLDMGRNFSLSEVENGVHVAIIGIEIVNKIFNKKKENALGAVISVGNTKYKVIGIMLSKGSSMNSSEDRRVTIPLNNGKRYYGTTKTSYRVAAAISSSVDMELAISQAIAVFRNIRGLKIGMDNDFEIRKSDGLIALIKENTSKLRSAAVAIGLITLLGAAIGLMNIMLVSVTERTREIGITKALGATSKNVLTQFLTEAVVICQLGGIVGIILGILIGNVVSKLMGGSFVVPWAWILLGIVTCALVGLVSGMYPAMKAAKLDPIESLRYE